MAFISIINLHITTTISSSSYMFLVIFCGQLLMYCIYTCLSDLWVLPVKNSCPCRDLNPGPPGTKLICYQLSPILAWMKHLKIENDKNLIKLGRLSFKCHQTKLLLKKQHTLCLFVCLFVCIHL